MMDPNDPRIPTVGQPFSVLTWYPTTIIACKCQVGKMVLVITTGMNNPSKCDHCGRMYMATGVSANAEILVQMVIATPAGQVM